MRWPRWLLWLFPSLAPRGTWADAVLVTDPAKLARLDFLYAETVAWVRAVRPDGVIAPERHVAFRVWPKHLRAPDGFGQGKVLVAGVCPGDLCGTLLVRAALVDSRALLWHESIHAITGVSDHPRDLFPGGA